VEHPLVGISHPRAQLHLRRGCSTSRRCSPTSPTTTPPLRGKLSGRWPACSSSAPSTRPSTWPPHPIWDSARKSGATTSGPSSTSCRTSKRAPFGSTPIAPLIRPLPLARMKHSGYGTEYGFDAVLE